MPLRFVTHTSVLIPPAEHVPADPHLYVYDLVRRVWIGQIHISPRPATPTSVIVRL